MSVRRVVPDIQSDDLAASRAFYEGLLGFETVMDLGWIVTVGVPDRPLAQINLLHGDASAPVTPHLSIEVDDVDAVFAAAQQQGADIVYQPVDEPWGVRRFFVADPSGRIINVMSHRTPTAGG